MGEMRAVVLVLVTMITLAVGCGEVVKLEPDATDPCATGVCECTAATEATDCAAHEVCDESVNGRLCQCAPAYKDQGGTCVFDVAPRDPKVTDPAVWIPVGPGASVDGSLQGNIDVGEALIDRTGMCAFSSLSQTFKMPPRSRAEPFKLLVTHSASDPGNEIGGGVLAIGVGGQWFHTAVSRNVYRTDTICLGESAYGGDVEFKIATLGSPLCTGGSTARIRVDQMLVQPATEAECPRPGTVVNGDFEQATGWTFSVLNAATGAIVAGVGENATRGAQLTTANRCSEATMTGTIALPRGDAQAIEVFWSGTNGTRLSASLGGIGVATLNANGVAKRNRFCVPAWARGNNTTISFFMQRQSDNGCTTALARTFMIDSVAIVNEPACGPVDISDPGFERIANTTGPMPGWALINDYVNDVEGGVAVTLNSMPSAHLGSGVLRLTSVNECASQPTATASFIVPPAQGAAGPAIKFFASVTANVNTTASAEAGFLNTTPFRVDLPENGGYAQHVLCLPKAVSGRPFLLRMSMRDSDGSSSCLSPIPVETALFDDVTVTTDASCTQ